MSAAFLWRLDRRLDAADVSSWLEGPADELQYTKVRVASGETKGSFQLQGSHLLWTRHN